MPRGERSGPLGTGPMTGKGMGYCAGFPTPGFMNPGFCGRGMRWFWRMGPYCAPPRLGYFYPPCFPFGMDPERAKEAELEFLKREAEDLEMALTEIKRRIEELEKREK